MMMMSKRRPWVLLLFLVGGRCLVVAPRLAVRRTVRRGTESSAEAEGENPAPEENFRSGFVAVVGSPNVGKSTLVNAFVGQKLCIATSKAQTTRHSILALAAGDGYQMALTDTPGVLSDPAYPLQKQMVVAARRACRDAEVVLFVTDIFEAEDAAANIRRWVGDLGGEDDEDGVPLVVAVNKVDLIRDTDDDGAPLLGEAAMALVGSEELALQRAREAAPDARAVVPVSALRGNDGGVESLKKLLVSLLPASPPVYPPDENDDDGDDGPLTNRPARFFAAEIVREAILTHYSKEIPYSCEVRIDRFRENLLPDILEIHATILVARDSQKAIVIGAKGNAIKDTGIAAREALEDFFQVNKVRLYLRCKVRKNWRSDESALRQFGYID